MKEFGPEISVRQRIRQRQGYDWVELNFQAISLKYVVCLAEFLVLIQSLYAGRDNVPKKNSVMQ